MTTCEFMVRLGDGWRSCGAPAIALRRKHRHGKKNQTWPVCFKHAKRKDTLL